MNHMRPPIKHLEILRAVKKRVYHPIAHEIHKKYRISKKTLFYIKEYGPRTNVAATILKESVKILLLASIISSLGGLALENIKTLFVSIMPLIVMLPALNDMIGDYGTIVSSRFATMLHEGKISGNGFKNRELRKLLLQVLVIAVFTAVLSAAIALAVSSLSGYSAGIAVAYKVLLIAVVDVVALVSVLFLASLFFGLYIFRKGEDPDNFLIPITTSIADFGNMFILAALVVLLF